MTKYIIFGLILLIVLFGAIIGIQRCTLKRLQADLHATKLKLESAKQQIKLMQNIRERDDEINRRTQRQINNINSVADNNIVTELNRLFGSSNNTSGNNTNSATTGNATN